MEAPRSGAPAHDTGLPPGVSVGGLGRRLVAYLIDSVVPGIAATLVSSVVPQLSGVGAAALTIGAVVLAIAWAGLCWWLLSQRAATPGMRVMKLQLVGFLDGRPVGWGRVLVRWAVYTGLSATGVGLLLMLVFMLVHPRHQGWHDLAANAVVIVERPLAPPRPREVEQRAQPAEVDEVAEAPALVGASAGSRGATVAAPPPPVPAPVVPVVSTPVSPPAAPAAPTVVQAPVPAPAPPRSILEGWSAELDDGREVAVTGLVLLGRNPQPSAGEEDAQLIKLADETRTVSKTHLAIGVDDAGLFVVDRGSTNGSTVTTPDRQSTHCAPDTAVSVGEGSIVSIGDHWLRIRRDPS